MGNSSYYLFLVPVLFPVLSALLMGFCKPLKNIKKKYFHEIFLVSCLSLNAITVLIIAFSKDNRLELFSFTDELIVLFKPDNLSVLFTLLVSAMYLLAGIYSCSYMLNDKNKGRFHMSFLLSLAMLMGVGYSGNLITLVIFFELMSLLSAPMVLHTMDKTAIAAAFKFVYYSIVGASLVLVGFFLLYTYGISIEFIPGGVLDLQKLSGNENIMLAGTLLVILGFGSKAGMFPLHAWLPTAHPVAPSPASAILSGIITKAGVFAIIRFVFFLTGSEFIRYSWVQYTWISLALFSILLGSILAFTEPELKRRLAYSSISQVSYILFGLATLTAGGFMGALLHIVFHSIAKDALFLFSGIVIHKTGKTEVADLRGIGKNFPLLMVCFTLLALSAAGIPATGGFISKWYLATASLSSGLGFFVWLGPALLLFSALLTAGYLFPVSIAGFFPGNDNLNYAKIKIEKTLYLPVLILCILLVFLGLFPQILINFFNDIIQGLL